MYGTCPLCRDKKIEANNSDNMNIQWKEWGRIEETYQKEEKTVKVFNLAVSVAEAFVNV